MPTAPQIAVAGNVCLDIIPSWPGQSARPLGELLAPGRLTHVGPAVLATGGAVCNTGLALHRLGVAVRLIARIGDDTIGGAIRERLTAAGAGLADHLVVSPGQASSYSVVISPPGVDRVFLHCPGASDHFRAADVDAAALAAAGVRLLHFGYPPLMAGMSADNGAELVALFAAARAAGLVCSLDMAHIDPASPAGRIDWPRLLDNVLPHVDLFLPSLDETLVSLGRPTASPTGLLLSELGERLLSAGPAVVMIKLGEDGLYIRTTDRADRLAELAGRSLSIRPADWLARELLVPCFDVELVGATGAGDCTIAGLLAGMLTGRSAHDAAVTAAAVGACSVERADATSGVPGWPGLQSRLKSGWSRRPNRLPLPHWRADASGLWQGPADRSTGV